MPDECRFQGEFSPCRLASSHLEREFIVSSRISLHLPAMPMLAALLFATTAPRPMPKPSKAWRRLLRCRDRNCSPQVQARQDRQTSGRARSRARSSSATKEHALYYVLGNGKAVKYRVATAKKGFEWSGTNTVSAKVKWPDWRPPAAMRKRRPELPAYMARRPGNPLGARAIYLGGTHLPHPRHQ